VPYLTKNVSILMGSESDREIAKKAEAILEKFGIPFETKVLSSHRNHKELDKYLEGSESDVFIAIAGLSAALPGFVASLTNKPVIGVPVSGKLNLDSILSIVQLPTGVPVGTVGLDNGSNAALLAAEILALSDPELAKSIEQYRGRRV
jgi:5-(carboxyamino)imidazole ribonucleotide mutase